MKKSLVFLFLLVSVLTNAQIDLLDIAVTRDIEAEQHAIDDYNEYLEKHPFKQTKFKEVNRFMSRDEKILIIVESELYPLIQDAIATYQEDLFAENLSSILVRFSGTSITNLRTIMQNYFNSDNIIGAIHIGDLPAAWYEMYEDFNNDGVPDDTLMVNFPIDLYFSDLDGFWNDTDNDGKYDEHGGELHPDIWFSRIKADNLTFVDYSESELINRYFERNHQFRNGNLLHSDRALAYIDDSWQNAGNYYQENMETCFDEVVLVNAPNSTTAPDYRANRLPSNYDFIQIHVHSSSTSHYFYFNNGNDYERFYNDELNPINPTAYFYNLFACSNARYEQANNMGSLYLLGNDYCMGTIGSSKTGSMLYFENFYNQLSTNNTFGSAMKNWWEQSVDVYNGPAISWQRSWFYGMVFLGDITLKLNPPRDLFVDGDYVGYEDGSQEHPFSTIQEGIDHAEENASVFVAAGIYYENIVWPATNGINLIGENMETTIIDGNQSGSVIRFEENLAGIIDTSTVIIDFTIRNGSASYGSGIYCCESNPILANVTITGNSASYGGGIYCRESNLILTNVMITDNSASYGGGIYCYYYSNPSLINVTITGNSASSYGGGFFCTYNSNTSLGNCIMWNDSPQEVYFSQNYNANSITIAYSDIQGGEVGVVTNNNGAVYWDAGNIDADPLFIDAENDDYHLTFNSPCINAGNPDSPLDPDGSIVEMGTFYFEINYGDVDGNGEIQIYDASLALQNAVGLIDFNENQILATDVDGDGIIQTYDASLILQYVVGLIDEFPVGD